MRSIPNSAKRRSELTFPSVLKLKPISEPEKTASAMAGKNAPSKAAGSVSGTDEPEPSRFRGPVASHRTFKLAVAGVSFGPKNVKESMTGTSFAARTARRPSPVTSNAAPGSWMVQKSPDGRIPPLLS